MSPESDEQDESSHDTTINQVTWDTQQDFFTVEFLESSPTQVGFYMQNIINGAFYKQNSQIYQFYFGLFYLIMIVMEILFISPSGIQSSTKQ